MHTSCSGFSQSFTVAPQALPFTSHVGSKQSLCLKHFGATKKTFVGDFSVQVYCLAAISELRGALLKVLTWDVVNPGSVPCYGVRIWIRHSRDLKSDLPFPWGSNLTLDYWLSGVSVLVCFFTDKRTGLRLAPRDISWQRTLSAKRTSQKNKNITLIHYPLQPYLQHPTGKVTTQTWHFLLQGKHNTYATFGTLTRWYGWHMQHGGRNTAPFSQTVKKHTSCFTDAQSWLVYVILFPVSFLWCLCTAWKVEHSFWCL